MLLSTSRSSPRLSRLTGLALVSAALLACLLPTFQHAPVQAQPQQAEPETKLLQMIVKHLDDKNTIEATASLAKALRETGWRDPLLSPPSEVLPPLA